MEQGFKIWGRLSRITEDERLKFCNMFRWRRRYVAIIYVNLYQINYPIYFSVVTGCPQGLEAKQHNVRGRQWKPRVSKNS